MPARNRPGWRNIMLRVIAPPPDHPQMAMRSASIQVCLLSSLRTAWPQSWELTTPMFW